MCSAFKNLFQEEFNLENGFVLVESINRLSVNFASKDLSWYEYPGILQRLFSHHKMSQSEFWGTFCFWHFIFQFKDISMCHYLEECNITWIQMSKKNSMILANLHLPSSLETHSCVISLHEGKAFYRSSCRNFQLLWSCETLSLFDFCPPPLAFWKNLKEF